MQEIKYRIEAAAMRFSFAGFRLLPLDVASWFGGFLGRAIGPMLPAHRTAEKNLAMVFPELTPPKRRQILSAMWDNLGRNAAELPHLPGNPIHQRVTIHGMENVPPGNRPSIFFSGHFGNWELSYPIAHRRGIPVTLIYRKANNPHVDAIVAGLRGTQAAAMFAKGPSGVVKLMRAIKDGQSLGMLIDQKMNDGIAVPFFGRDAMTAPAIAELALRYDMPIVPVRVTRMGGCHFEAAIFPPLTYEKTGNRERNVLTILTRINALLESWIRERPEQWFWVHKRWPK